jgi:hypothetical protein
MNNKKPRKKFSTINKYQERIILLTIVPSVLIFISFSCITLLLTMDGSKIFLNQAPGVWVKALHQWASVIITILCGIIAFALILSFTVSHSMVGAFGRIIREMDEVIDGNSNKLIIARPNDELVQDLLKRINFLLKSYIDKKN